MMVLFGEMVGVADQGETRAEMQEGNYGDRTRPRFIVTNIWTHGILKSHKSGKIIQISEYDHSSQQSDNVSILIGGQVRFPISTDVRSATSGSRSSCAMCLFP